jgi:hypothetical protein
MHAPILYEVNTRAWLRELTEQHGREISLAEVPDEEIERWRRLGFTHIWLMGVWQVGPKAREIALRFWRKHWSGEISSREEDVVGSPYAIQEYSVDSTLGEALSLLMLKERLSRAGLRLIVDFVPNHLGIDSSEPSRFPARFVHSTERLPGTFEGEARFGKRYFAHGRDPFFEPWIDTVQVDYRVQETHHAMRSLAQTVSMYGDGLRCDMAMLVLPEIFEETWKHFPSPAAHRTGSDFWRKTLQEIRQLQPQVELIAEVYWDREEQLQEIGFDYTYNKRVYDYLVQGQIEELIVFLGSRSGMFLNRSVHFIENHDEKRAAAVFDREQHQLAAALILFLPGMALLHEGQLEGRKEFARIQMSKRAQDRVDAEIAGFYETLLMRLQGTYVRRGKAKVICHPDEAVVAVEWKGPEASDVAVVNFSQNKRVLEMAGSEVLYSTSGEQVEIRADGVCVPGRSAVIVRGKNG